MACCWSAVGSCSICWRTIHEISSSIIVGLLVAFEVTKIAQKNGFSNASPKKSCFFDLPFAVFNRNFASHNYFLSEMAKEKDLTTVQSLATADFFRAVTSAGASVKATAQAVSDRVIALASKTGSGDANDLTTAGMYWCNGASVSNLPSTSYYYRVRVEVYSGAVNQYANRNNSNEIYFRTLANNTWSSWALMPTRAEVDALNSNIGECSIKKFSNSGSGGTAEVPLSSTGIIFVLSVIRSTNTDVSQEGYGLIKCYNNDARLTRVVGLSGFSATMSNNNAVITMAPYTNVMLIYISQ